MPTSTCAWRWVTRGLPPLSGLTRWASLAIGSVQLSRRTPRGSRLWGLLGGGATCTLTGLGAPVCPWTTRPIGRAARRVHWIDTSGVVFVNPV
ncbi:hypothetical protein JCM18920_3429 [Cutibacterium acnes JCM 18920]|nr:hypothetical protein JCM18920_3429 [Cutibacterium acnes JCM 18920]